MDTQTKDRPLSRRQLIALETRRNMEAMGYRYADTGKDVAASVNWLADAAAALLTAAAWGLCAALVVGLLFGLGFGAGVAAFCAGFLGCFFPDALGRWLVMLLYSAVWGAVGGAVLALLGVKFGAGWLLSTVVVVVVHWARLAHQPPPVVEAPAPAPDLKGPPLKPQAPKLDLGDWFDEG